ncbi:hypothetical protein K431DRAFT_151854 [Polychaeton citri CBS 116435]|uniref:Uncharacterized protein n=1 Tax=Polychaeton citri CBS 116435 TaxID=1314669 RepID=A0A9P4Q377_9PEZI|nr:hypothetical protein K431DRAFT_151854 [Polychaeton citri CBS 116435]
MKACPARQAVGGGLPLRLRLPQPIARSHLFATACDGPGHFETKTPCRIQRGSTVLCVPPRYCRPFRLMTIPRHIPPPTHPPTSNPGGHARICHMFTSSDDGSGWAWAGRRIPYLFAVVAMRLGQHMVNCDGNQNSCQAMPGQAGRGLGWVALRCAALRCVVLRALCNCTTSPSSPCHDSAQHHHACSVRNAQSKHTHASVTSRGRTCCWPTKAKLELDSSTVPCRSLWLSPLLVFLAPCKQ